MKIVYISSATIPSRTANSIQVMKMCQAMVQNGHDVELLVPRRRIERDLCHINWLYHYGIQTQFTVHRLPYYSRFGEHLFNLLAVLKARYSGADIIFSRNLPAVAWSVLMRIPTICELHAMPNGITGPYYFRLFALCKFSRTLIVVITNALKKDLLERYMIWMNRHRIVIAPDGVDMERFTDLPNIEIVRRKLGLNKNAFIAGYAGHLYTGKGIEVVLGLANRCPKTDFLVMGGEPSHLTALKRELKHKGLNNVFLVGFVPNAELPLYLTACDVLLLPNQRLVFGSGEIDIARWTSPMKLFEYMACGKLIIASDLPVLREVLSDENAVLCDPTDLDAWQQVLERAKINKAWRQEIGNRAYADAQSYTWTNRVEACLGPLVENCINRGGE